MRLFAPVLTKGLVAIEVEANRDIIEKLKQLKVIEERDGKYYIRRCANWRKKIQELLIAEDIFLLISLTSGKIIYSFVDRKEIENIKDALRQREHGLLINSDGDCEVWEEGRNV